MAKSSRKKKPLFQRLLFIFFTTFFLLYSGCAKKTESHELILCAASLNKILSDFDTQGLSLEFGASRTLLVQKNAGAPVGLLLLADSELVSELEQEEGYQSKAFASNSLVLVESGSRQGVDERALESKQIIVADPRTSPLGRYTEQAMESKALAGRCIFVRDATAVLANLALGYGDLGVVYGSDVRPGSELRVVKEIPPDSHKEIVYEAVLFDTASPVARRLYTELTSPSGQAKLKRAGFEALLEEASG